MFLPKLVGETFSHPWLLQSIVIRTRLDIKPSEGPGQWLTVQLVHQMVGPIV